MQDRVDFAYNFQSLYIRLFLSKFGNYETKLIIGIQRYAKLIDIYIVDDAVMVI